MTDSLTGYVHIGEFLSDISGSVSYRTAELFGFLFHFRTHYAGFLTKSFQITFDGVLDRIRGQSFHRAFPVFQKRYWLPVKRSRE